MIDLLSRPAGFMANSEISVRLILKAEIFSACLVESFSDAFLSLLVGYFLSQLHSPRSSMRVSMIKHPLLRGMFDSELPGTNDNHFWGQVSPITAYCNRDAVIELGKKIK